jgi:osmoprotectant transport system ATP-binding protein
VLLMDEPFGALDPVTRAALQLEMKRVHEGSGKTIVLVTHDIDEALLLASKVVVLDRGRVVQVGSPLELLSKPANDFVADFIGRADRGIKLLSLRAIGPYVGSAPAAPEVPTIAITATVREAVSCMAAAGVAVLGVRNSDGRVVGSVQAADLLLPARHG